MLMKQNGINVRFWEEFHNIWYSNSTIKVLFHYCLQTKGSVALTNSVLIQYWSFYQCWTLCVLCADWHSLEWSRKVPLFRSMWICLESCFLFHCRNILRDGHSNVSLLSRDFRMAFFNSKHTEFKRERCVWERKSSDRKLIVDGCFLFTKLSHDSLSLAERLHGVETTVSLLGTLGQRLSLG